MNAPDHLGMGWRSARREVTVAVGLVLVIAVAGWAVYGPAAASVIVLVSVAFGLIVLHALATPSDDQASQPTALDSHQAGGAGLVQQLPLTHSFPGFWRTRSDLSSATKSLAAWDYTTRRRLQNLLAARLAEHHRVSLAQDPATARHLLIGPSDRDDLWFWIDPERTSPPDAGSRPGIPPKVLAALIDRLEHL